MCDKTRQKKKEKKKKKRKKWQAASEHVALSIFKRNWAKRCFAIHDSQIWVSYLALLSNNYAILYEIETNKCFNVSSESFAAGKNGMKKSWLQDKVERNNSRCWRLDLLRIVSTIKTLCQQPRNVTLQNDVYRNVKIFFRDIH